MSARCPEVGSTGRTQLQIGHDPLLFEGHFPGHPVLPGAKLLDLCIAQLRQRGVIGSGAIEVSSAKFLAMVPPGATLELNWSIGAEGQCRFECERAGERVATGSLREAAP